MHYTDLGYDEYEGSNGYLSGPEWTEIKDYIYHNKIMPYHCGICKVKKGLRLHKRSYKFLTLTTLRRHYWYISFLVNRYLRKYMVYLCYDCNNSVHFYDNGARVPLDYNSLMRRERLIRRRRYPLWLKILINTPIVTWKILVFTVKTLIFIFHWLYINYSIGDEATRRRKRYYH